MVESMAKSEDFFGISTYLLRFFKGTFTNDGQQDFRIERILKYRNHFHYFEMKKLDGAVV